jgi:hypothetical protein
MDCYYDDCTYAHTIEGPAAPSAVPPSVPSTTPIAPRPTSSTSSTSVVPSTIAAAPRQTSSTLVVPSTTPIVPRQTPAELMVQGYRIPLFFFFQKKNTNELSIHFVSSDQVHLLGAEQWRPWWTQIRGQGRGVLCGCD